MKKLLSIALVLAMLFSLAITIPVSAGATAPETVSKWDGTVPATRYNLQGQGTEAAPFLIQNATDLANVILYSNISWGRYFSLTCDIDLAGHDWPGIGTDDVSQAFSGIFLGNGHTIYNLSMTRTDSNFTRCTGFFNQTISATVKDLAIVGAKIDVSYSSLTDHAYVGGLVGVIGGASVVDNCFVDIDVNTETTASAKIANVGLVAGRAATFKAATYRNSAINIKNSTTTGTVSSSCSYFDNIGGIVGQQTKYTVSDGVFSQQPLVISNCNSNYSIIRSNGNSKDRYGVLLGESDTACTFTNNNASVNVSVASGVAPTVYPSGAFGVKWGTHTASTSCSRYVVVDTTALDGGAKTVNPTPYSADSFTAAADEIKLISSMISGNFAQNGIGDNEKNIRFVSETTFGVNAMSETGFVVEFGGKSDKLSGKVVYTSLMAEGNTITPTGKYYIAYGISDIPTTVSGNITVTPYAVLLDGTTVYGASAQYTITNGALAQNS